MKSFFSKSIILSIIFSLNLAGTGTKSAETTTTSSWWSWVSPIAWWQWGKSFFVSEKEKPKEKLEEKNIPIPEEKSKASQKTEKKEPLKTETTYQNLPPTEPTPPKKEEQQIIPIPTIKKPEEPIQNTPKKEEILKTIPENINIQQKKPQEVTREEFGDIEKTIVKDIKEKYYTQACNNLKNNITWARKYGLIFKNTTGDNLLHLAAQSGDNKMFTCFVDVYGYHATLSTFKTSRYLNLKNGHGQTPLYLAVEYQDKNAIQHLLNFDPDVDAMTTQNDTALNHAIAKGKTDTVELLITSKANPTIQNNSKSDALGALKFYEEQNGYDNKKLHDLVTKYHDEYTKKVFGNFEDINNYMKKATLEGFKKDAPNLLDSLNAILKTLTNLSSGNKVNERRTPA
jgi:ankyrin repeat protein